MSETNPQIEKQLDQLATICCEMLESGASASAKDDAAIDQLLKSLLMSGYARKDGRTLQSDLERRVKEQCREPAIHRGGALSSITGRLQEKFDERTRWESRQPNEKGKAKTANISSATDA